MVRNVVRFVHVIHVMECKGRDPFAEWYVRLWGGECVVRADTIVCLQVITAGCHRFRPPGSRNRQDSVRTSSVVHTDHVRLRHGARPASARLSTEALSSSFLSLPLPFILAQSPPIPL